MNMYLRLLLTLLLSMRRSRIAPTEESVTAWRVLPGDVDLFGHMNNARYLAVMDLARVDFLARLGLLRTVATERWMVPIADARLEFKGALRPFERYTVHTRLLTWDDRAFYLQQDFRRADGSSRLVGTGWVKVVFRGAKGSVPPADVIAASGHAEIQRPSIDGETAAKLGLAPQRAPHAARSEPLAIVGVGCRLPGGVCDIEALWRLLQAEMDAIVDIPEARWDPRAYHDPTGRSPGRTYVQRAGLLREDLRAFDATFFGISPREAATLDPQQRLLLEVSWEALESAGIAPTSLAGSRTGVFVGGFMVDNLLIHSNPDNRTRLAAHSAAASTLTMLSNRLSYFYDLRGPSLSVDTACSSSLVALHLACKAVWSGEAEAALVGGANAILVPETQVTMAKGRFLSRKGHCHAFGEDADGYVRAEGAAVLVIKPLSAALRDGNPVLCTILGTATNQDGRTPGITVPNGEAQIAVMREAYTQAGVDPREVVYVEAHGTGTPAGDPVEARAIGEVIGAGRDARDACLIGSVKTHLGHLEAAAGVAGVLKAALCLAHRAAPPHLHAERVNPAIDLERLGLRLSRGVTPLPERDRRIAGVNSFGYGGSNAHVVLGEAPRAQVQGAPPASGSHRALVLPLSARCPEALRALAGRYADLLESTGKDPARVCRSAAIHRAHHRHRVAWTGRDSATAVRALRSFARGERDGAALGLIGSGEPHEGKLAFVYTGMGPQWWGMGRELMRAEPVFRAAIEACDAAFRGFAGWSILDELTRDEATSRMNRTEVAQPANAAIQIALTQLLTSWGITPAGVVGHSIGEVGSAYASGALDLRSAMMVAHHRSRLQQRLAGRGAMLAVGLGAEEAGRRIAHAGDRLAIAAINSADSVTLAGDSAELEALMRALESEGRFARMLRVEVPYHSPMMAPIEGELRAALRALQPATPRLPLYSTVTGARVQDEPFDAEYVWRNVRETVRFRDAIDRMIEDGYTTFVEIGPHPVLAASIRAVLQARGARGEIIASLVRGQPDGATIAQAYARLYAAGADADHRAYAGDGDYEPLPTYPWQKKVHWSEGERTLRRRVGPREHALITSREPGPPLSLEVDLNLGVSAYLMDHVVAGASLFPAAGHVELALEARRALTGEAVCSLEGIELVSAVPLQHEETTRLVLTTDREGASFHVDLHGASGADRVTMVARGRIHSPGRAPAPLDLEALAGSLPEEVPPEALYDSLAQRGLSYGPAFRAVTSARRGPSGILASIALPDGLDDAGYNLHPVLLDAALHALLGLAAPGGGGREIVPIAIDRVHHVTRAPRKLIAYGRMSESDGRAAVLRGDVTLAREDGAVVAEVTGVTCRVLDRVTDRDAALRARLYQRRWEQAPAGADRAGDTAWVIVGADRPGVERPLPQGAALLSAEASPAAIADAVRAARGPVSILDLRFVPRRREAAQHPRLLEPVARGVDPVAAGADHADALLRVVHALPPASCARYVVVTQGAEAVGAHDPAPSLALAPLLGLARTAMTERPDLRLTVMDLDAGPDGGALERAFSVLARLGREQEIALRGEAAYVARIARADLPGAAAASASVALPALGEGHGYALDVGEPGKLDTLSFVARERARLSPGEVEIEVEVASLGFKDVMKAMRLLPDFVTDNTYFGGAIGMEGTGRISRVGPGVDGLTIGDRVYGVAPGFLRSHVVLPASRVVPLPDDVSFADGSSLIVYLTAYHALVDVARVSPGERVLVHGASGGVGLAAIEIAHAFGAEVIATAGSEEKRRFLRDRGIAHVSTSRDVAFADDVLAWTGGRGVDVVLNFSPGEIVDKSLACLAPFGRFIEIGKMSFVQGASLPLRRFNENLVYAAIDFDRILAHKPEVVARLAREVIGRLVSGVIRPLPCALYGASHVTEAFRTMARAQHVGKLGITMRDEALLVRARARGARLSPDATYVVTGGLGGFGLEVTRWLVACGARHVALLSRRGASTPEGKAAIADLRARGAGVAAPAVDVGDRAALASALDEIRRTMPRIAGVFHAATVLDDRALADLDRASMDRVLWAKAGGAWNLHVATSGDDLEHFVLFSSIASPIGNAGQGNYVAANAFLDQLAVARRLRGLPALSVQWGVLAEAGLVARDDRLAKHLARLGIRGLTNGDALHALDRLFDGGLPHAIVADVSWAPLVEGLAEGAARHRYDELVADASAPDAAGAANARTAATSPALRALAALDDDALDARLLRALTTSISRVLGAAPEAIDVRVPLRDVGLDSLTAIEIAAHLEDSLGVRIPSMVVAGGASPRAIATSLAESVRKNASGATPAHAAAPEREAVAAE